MYLHTMRPPALSGPPPRRRRFPWARITLLLLLCAAAAYLFVPRYLNITADGLIEGDLIPIAPLFSARIASRLVQCDQDVQRGQPLAIVSNFLLEGQYAEDYQKAATALHDAQIAQTEGVTEALIEQASTRQKYLSAEYDARKLQVVKDAYERTYREGAIGRVAYDGARADWEAANAQAQALEQVWAEARARVQRIQDENASRLSASQQQLALAEQLQNQVHSQTLAAPIAGRIVECTAQPQAIVDPGAPLYKIFAPDRAYILAYFDPHTAAKLRVGQIAYIDIPGVDKPAEGTISAVLPSLSKLPDQLTRYFWQHQQWSEYRPVKIFLTRTPASTRAELTYDTQVHVRIPQHEITWQALSRTVVGVL